MNRSKTSRRGALAVMAFALITLGLGAAPPANAAGPSGPDSCLYGFVWRDGRVGDHVCVTSATRSQTAADNAAGPSRVQPGGGAYGPDTCRSGYVWRSAWSGDHVCVTSATRTQAANDNAAGPSRRALDSFSFSWSDINLSSASGDVRGNLTLELSPNGAFFFSGHLHNRSVIIGYKLSVACIVKTLDGNALSFGASGTVGPDSFLGSGSPNWDWNKSGTSAQVFNHWTAIPRNLGVSCRANSDPNFGALINDLKTAAQIAGQVIAIVG